MKRIETGNWTDFRSLPDLLEIDFHNGRREATLPYEQAMALVYEEALDVIKRAYAEGRRYVLFTHGWSTSRPGQATARSKVRSLIRSCHVTPFIVRKNCVQHYSCFLVAIRQKPDGDGSNTASTSCMK